MSSSKLASWMNKTVNNNITSNSSNICTFTYNEYFFMFPVSWEKILQQFVNVQMLEELEVILLLTVL